MGRMSSFYNGAKSSIQADGQNDTNSSPPLMLEVSGKVMAPERKNVLVDNVKLEREQKRNERLFKKK